MSTRSSVGILAEKLGVLQRELETLGFALDSRGSREAADVALITSARIGELRDDCGPDGFLENNVRKAAAPSLNLHNTLS
jgi:hypothetical protein